MLLASRDHPGRAVRLAYCLNLHPAEDLEGVLAGLAAVTLPLRERLAPGAPFAVGMYLPAEVALALADPAGRADLERLAAFLAEHGLDAATYNAFPFGGFHRPGLKRGVFRPRWDEPARLAYTLAVAHVAARCAGAVERSHLSISTHCGAHASDLRRPGQALDAVPALATAAARFAELERATGRRLVLALEPEPRSACNDTREWGVFARSLVRYGAEGVAGEEGVAAGEAERWLRRHLGLCLDACHAAVEFERPGDALGRAAEVGLPLGKLQFTSALDLPRPGADPEGRARLLALDEPVYLHQVTARAADGELLRLGDLGEAAALAGAERERFDAAERWRCHFHVPTDLAGPLPGAGGLGTTLADADALLDAALARPEAWGLDELQLEIETYTWSVLPGAARGPGSLVDGLEREYRHVLGRLAAAGWAPV